MFLIINTTCLVFTKLYCGMKQVYVNYEGDRAHAVNTSWAMLTLIYAGQVR
jgi:hypothetical protein